MDTLDSIRQRKSVRAFLPDQVSDDTISTLLELAACSPSGANSQPWQVAVVRGATRKRLECAMMTASSQGVESTKDYQYYPLQWTEPYLSRRVSCGQQLYDALNIERADRERRRAQWAANYRSFDAPVMLLFFLENHLAAGSYIDFGMFMQTLMLAAQSMGLATCPQAALGEYPHIVRAELGLSENLIVLCGMALGYEDTAHPVNSYRTPRVPVPEFTRWFD